MLRKSEFFKSFKIRILLCVELILIAVGVFGLFTGERIAWRMENPSRLTEERISLSPGVYTLRLQYIAEGSGIVGSFGVELDAPMYKSLQSNSVPFWGGLSEGRCQFYLLDSVDDLRLSLESNESMQIQRAEIVAGTEGSRIYLFWVIVVCMILDGILLLVMYHRRHPIPGEKLLVIISVPVFALISSIPVMVDYNIVGADLIYHLLRIEALTESIRRGELAVRIGSMWLSGHGYASSIFYGETWLTIPALLRILGFSMTSAYRVFLVLVNLATAWIAYISFSKCFQSRLIGVFGCALYTLAPYRIYNIYNRAAVGEFTAMIFLPLLVWGFYRIYTEDPEGKGYLWNWVMPVIGFSGIIQSHALTCEMVGFFVVLLCLILWKKTFQKRTFMVLCSVIGMTIAVNVWFLVPFLDMMSADSYNFSNNANMLIQSRGIYPAQIFYTLQAGGSSSHFVENGMLNTEPIGLGAALLLCLLLWLFLRSERGKSPLSAGECREKRTGDIGLGLTVVALFMSTCYFPWDFLSSHSSLLAAMIGSLQFPTRITSIVTILGVFVACVMGLWAIRGKVAFFSGKTVLALIVLTAVFFGSYQVNSILLTREGFFRLYTMGNAGTTAVLGAEYLPVDTSTSHMIYHAPILGDGVVMENYWKDGLEVIAGVSAIEESYVEFPLLYYKGYRAENAGTGEALSVVKGDNGDVRLLLPENFQGNIRVWYAGMWYWHVAEILSVAVGGGFLVYLLLHKQRVNRLYKAKKDW